MFSPALRNRQRVLAGQAATAAKKPRGGAARARLRGETAPAVPAPSETGAPASEYAALLAVLHENIRSLSDIQSHELRQPKKAEYARQFKTWVDGVVAADWAVQDEILVTMMIWAVDCRDFERAIELASFVLRHRLALPERYTRTPACFLAEEIADQALQQHEQVPLKVLGAVLLMTAKFDMPDPVRARLLKAIGRAWRRKADAFDPTADNAPAGGALAYLAEAISHHERALALWGDVGVKKDIQTARALQKKLTAAAELN